MSFLWAGLLLAAADPPLATARQVRELPPARAADRLPARLEVVVTQVGPGPAVFVQDATGGTFLNRPPADVPWARGLRVRVDGVTYPGLYVPGVRPERVEVLGRADLPAPPRVSADDLLSGRWHYQRVELEGVVRAAVPAPPGCVLRLAAGGRDIDVRLDPAPPAPPPAETRVAVRGLAAGAINDRRQLVRPYLMAHAPADLTVLRPAPADPFARPALPAGGLLGFAAAGPADRRVKLAGTVTAAHPDGRLCLRDGGTGVAVEGWAGGPFEPGDVVEAVGFPRMGAFTGHLADADCRRVAAGPPPAPVPLPADGLLAPAREADLVTVEGELAEAYPGPDGDTLALRAGDARFAVRCPSGWAGRWRPGSTLRVTGTYRLTDFREAHFTLQPTAFEVRPRTPADVAEVARPPWWTAERLAVALGLAAAAAAAAGGWAVALRRQVRRQSAVIRRQVAREAARAERERIAREVHDTVEQELVGLALRLDAAAATAPAGGPTAEALAVVRRLVGRVHAEVRGFVGHLRADAADLPAALRRLAADLGPGPPISVAVAGDPWPVPPVAAHHLARVAQEAVTNALKHARPTAVAVTLAYAPDRLRLAVTDDGPGLSPGAAGRPGHFGLVGMGERVRKAGGTLSLSAGPGLTVAVELPRPAGAAP